MSKIFFCVSSKLEAALVEAVDTSHVCESTADGCVPGLVRIEMETADARALMSALALGIETSEKDTEQK